MALQHEKIYTIEELKERLQEILSHFAVKKATLFGSYAKNLATPKSDNSISHSSNTLPRTIFIFFMHLF